MKFQESSLGQSLHTQRTLPSKAKVSSVKQAIEAAQASMKGVRPTPGAAEVPGSVYNGIEADFASINNLVAELLGLFETRSFDSGETDA